MAKLSRWNVTSPCCPNYLFLSQHVNAASGWAVHSYNPVKNVKNWSYTHIGSGGVSEIAIDNSGFIYIPWIYYQGGVGNKYYLTKIDKHGEFVWEKNIANGTSNGMVPYPISGPFAPDGRLMPQVIVNQSGYIYTSYPFNNDTDVSGYMVKLDSDGNQIKVFRYTDDSFRRPYRPGYIGNNTDWGNLWVLRMDKNEAPWIVPNGNTTIYIGSNIDAAAFCVDDAGKVQKAISKDALYVEKNTQTNNLFNPYITITNFMDIDFSEDYAYIACKSQYSSPNPATGPNSGSGVAVIKVQLSEPSSYHWTVNFSDLKQASFLAASGLPNNNWTAFQTAVRLKYDDDSVWLATNNLTGSGTLSSQGHNASMWRIDDFGTTRSVSAYSQFVGGVDNAFYNRMHVLSQISNSIFVNHDDDYGNFVGIGNIYLDPSPSGTTFNIQDTGATNYKFGLIDSKYVPVNCQFWNPCGCCG